MTSLVAAAAGLCAWRALKHGGTWAGDRVLLEPVKTFDLTGSPVVVVYCEAGKIETTRGPLLGGSGLRIIVQTWIGAAAPEGFDVDASSALPFAIFWRQCARALFAGEPGSWSDLFKTFAGAVTSAETLFDLYETKNGERVAMRGQALYFGDGLAEPRLGLAAEGKWVEFLAKMRAESPELAGYADVIAAAIEGDPVEDWRADLAALGVPASDAATLRLTQPPLSPAELAGSLTIDAPITSADAPTIIP